MRVIFAAVASSFLFLLPIAAEAATRYAANTGVDGESCGASNTPCRSITQAVANSASGDRIIVRPGRYSNDLDGDGVLGEPGDEANTINVGTTLTIESTGGAAATVISKLGTTGGVISLFGNDSVFGKRNKGFTIRTLGGVNTTAVSVGGAGVTVSGNVLVGPVNIGFGATGNDALLRDNRVLCPPGSGGIGFFIALGTGVVVDHNVVQGCGQGFTGAGADLVLRSNLAIDNSSMGFNLADFGALFGNAALGNRGTGVVLNSGSTPGLIAANTFAGNGTTAGTNCGMQNNTGASVTATGNFWGAASGPGADPADLACDAVGSTTVTAPVATKDATPVQAPLR